MTAEFSAMDYSSELEAARIEAWRVTFNARLEALETRLTAKIESVNARVDTVRAELVLHRWLLSLLVAMNAATLGLVFRIAVP